MFKFVADNVGGAGTKRKQSPRPCLSCKRRHKRCSHGNQTRRPHPLATVQGSPQGKPRSADTATNELTGTRAPSQTQASRLNPSSGLDLSDAQIRFVANLSPESAFIINSRRQEESENISRHGVGLWLGQKDEGVAEEETAETEEATDFREQVLDSLAGQGLLLSALRPALRRECIATLPPEPEFGFLCDLFFSKIDPIFPLLRDEAWEKHGVMETVALKQCICLVASSDPAMRPYLRLPHADTVLSQIDFKSRIAAVVRQSMDLGFIVDKIVLLQVCTLMSMYVENEGFGQLSTYYCAQAVLHEQTLGFHVGWPDGKAGGERSRRIFWCVWVLDRLNAATNGRPTLIHRSDMGSQVINSIDDQPPPFRLLLHIAEFLESTISLYRPQMMEQARAERADHTFEDFVEAAGAQNLNNSLLASVELFYLFVVILRGKPAGQRPSSELQWFCASRIVAVASGEFKDSLVFWPILPHSVTVAASVAYRSLRNSPMSYNRRRAYMLFHDGCEVLDDLSKAFLSARAMARLAMDTMQEVERVATEKTRRDSTRMVEQRPARDKDRYSQESHITGQSQSQDAYGITEALDAAVSHEVPGMSFEHFDANFFNGFEGEAGIFGEFDPNFNLGRIDAIFSANLDLSATHLRED